MMIKVWRTLLSAFVLLLLFGINSFAQSDSESDSITTKFRGFKNVKFAGHQNVVTMSPVPFFVGQIPFCGEIRLTYERMVSHNQSLSLGLSYNYPSIFLLVLPAIANPNSATLKNYSLRGGRVTLAYRYYPLKSKTAPGGLFFGPYGSFNFVKIKERKGNDASYDLVYYADACVVAGYQIPLRKGVYMEFMGGLGYRMNKVYEYDGRTKTSATHDYYIVKLPFANNFKVLLQMNICYGF